MQPIVFFMEEAQTGDTRTTICLPKGRIQMVGEDSMQGRALRETVGHDKYDMVELSMPPGAWEQFVLGLAQDLQRKGHGGH